MLLRAAKARALLQGRDHALPDDVQHARRGRAAHRLVLAPEALDLTGDAGGRRRGRGDPSDVGHLVRGARDTGLARTRAGAGRRPVRRRAAVGPRRRARAARGRRRGLGRARLARAARPAHAQRAAGHGGRAARGRRSTSARARCRCRRAASSTRCSTRRSRSRPGAAGRASASTRGSPAAAAARWRRRRSSCPTRCRWRPAPSSCRRRPATTRCSCCRGSSASQTRRGRRRQPPALARAPRRHRRGRHGRAAPAARGHLRRAHLLARGRARRGADGAQARGRRATAARSSCWTRAAPPSPRTSTPPCAPRRRSPSTSRAPAAARCCCPGDKRPTAVDPTLSGWPHLHARLAVVPDTGRPLLAGLTGRRGDVIYVSARIRSTPPAGVGTAAGARMLVVPRGLAGRRAAFSVAGCHGYTLERSRASRRPTVGAGSP